MKKQVKRKWSQSVTEKSRSLELEEGVFTWKDPAKIAESLAQSAFESQKRKGSPYQAAMSMLNFYINRAGKKLSQKQKAVLLKAKKKLQGIFDKEEQV